MVLRFLGSDDAGVQATKYCRIKFANPHLDGLPMWGPSNAGVTYICERLTRIQHGYYGGFPWWSNDGAFQWSGGSADSYYGICPYDTSGNGTGNVHNWEISGVSNGSDHQVNRAGSTVTVTHGVMRTQMLRINYNGGNKFGLFYINAPSTANADVIQGPPVGSEANSAGAGNVNPTSPHIGYGDSPWTDFPKERASGDLGRIKIFNTLLTEADGVSEAGDMSRLVTSAGTAAIWYGKTNWRTVDDLTCDYGTGRSFVWHDATYKAACVPLGS